MFLGFDLDGVIIDHTFVKIKLAKKFGFSLNEPQTHADNLYRLLGPAKYIEFKYYLYDDHQSAVEGVIMPGAKEILETLKRINIPFAVISRRKNNHDIPISILSKYGLWPDVLNQLNVFFAQSREDKNTIAVSLGVSHFIDDELKALDRLIDVPVKYLFDPYNAVANCPYRRFVSWKEFYDAIVGDTNE